MTKNKEYQINWEIKAQTVMLIDDAGGHDIIQTKDAVYKAQSVGLDLVCVSNSQSMPICKIVDYNQFLFIQKKKRKEAEKNQHKTETKEIQLRPQIAKNDLNVKTKKAREELLKGNRIRFVVSFKGREISHSEFGLNLLNTVIEDLSDISDVFKQPAMNGRLLECTIVPKK